MFDRTPSEVNVTIGGETRIYEAFVTTAPATLDRPSTVTLEESSFAESRTSGSGADHVRHHARPKARTTRADCQRRPERFRRPATAKGNTCSHQPIPSWSAATRCSSGCGTDSRCHPTRRCIDGAQSSAQSETTPAGRWASQEVAP